LLPDNAGVAKGILNDMVGQKPRNLRLGRLARSPEEVRSQRLVTYVTMPRLQELQSIVDGQGKSLSG
jgi:hypothetical protein